MITTKITITPYLAEYMLGKYNNGADEAMKIPDPSDLYHLIWQLMSKRPKDCTGMDNGNLEIILPCRREGKNPQYYNYLSERSARMIENKIKQEFNEELHSMISDNAERGREYLDIEVVNMFMCNYCIESVTEDALLKNHQRWKENIRKMRVRRNYKKKLNFQEKNTDQTSRFVR